MPCIASIVVSYCTSRLKEANNVTLIGSGGLILTVPVMKFGISLSMHLIQAISRPGKTGYEYAARGLDRYDKDPIHCRHCTGMMRTEAG